MSKYQALIDALKASLTGDKWERHGAGVYSLDNVGFEVAVCFTQDNDDAAYIAAANPATIRSLLADLERAEKDAERYRFLAEHCRSTSEHWGGRWSIVVEGPAPKTHDSEDEFDAAIDAAISLKGEQGGGEG